MVGCAAASLATFEIETDGPGEDPPGAALVLDLVHLSRQTFGDHELERELLSLFEHQAAQFASRLEAPSQAATSVWRAELVHTLKGSARAVGAFRIGHAAEKYEEALRQGRESGAERDRLSAEIVTARGAIMELLKGA